MIKHLFEYEQKSNDILDSDEFDVNGARPIKAFAVTNNKLDCLKALNRLAGQLKIHNLICSPLCTNRMAMNEFTRFGHSIDPFSLRQPAT